MRNIYPFTVIHIKAFKKYLDRIVAIGVQTKVNRSKWAAPKFIIPKKAGQVWFISEFQAIKQIKKHTPYNLTNIKENIYKLSNFPYTMTLDSIMRYYNISLTGVDKRICTIGVVQPKTPPFSTRRLIWVN